MIFKMSYNLIKLIITNTCALQQTVEQLLLILQSLTT